MASRKTKAHQHISDAYVREGAAVVTAGDRKWSAKSITDQQMRHVMNFLGAWVRLHCVHADGTAWSQREIARALGISQNEWSAWLRGKARPGLPRLIQLRRATGRSLDVMLGLDREGEGTDGAGASDQAHTPPPTSGEHRKR